MSMVDPLTDPALLNSLNSLSVNGEGGEGEGGSDDDGEDTSQHVKVRCSEQTSC